MREKDYIGRGALGVIVREILHKWSEKDEIGRESKGLVHPTNETLTREGTLVDGSYC